MTSRYGSEQILVLVSTSQSFYSEIFQKKSLVLKNEGTLQTETLKGFYFETETESIELNININFFSCL